MNWFPDAGRQGRGDAHGAAPGLALLCGPVAAGVPAAPHEGKVLAPPRCPVEPEPVPRHAAVVVAGRQVPGINAAVREFPYGTLSGPQFVRIFE